MGSRQQTEMNGHDNQVVRRGGFACFGVCKRERERDGAREGKDRKPHRYSSSYNCPLLLRTRVHTLADVPAVFRVFVIKKIPPFR